MAKKSRFIPEEVFDSLRPDQQKKILEAEEGFVEKPEKPVRTVRDVKYVRPKFKK